jgi:hypothetical protein
VTIFVIAFQLNPTLLANKPHIVVQILCALGEDEMECFMTTKFNEHTPDASQNMSEPTLIPIVKTQAMVQPPTTTHMHNIYIYINSIPNNKQHIHNTSNFVTKWKP